MTDKKRFKRLSAIEAMRALYVDFEGGRDKPPVLLGIHRRGRGDRPFVHQVVVDATFACLGSPSMPLREAVAIAVVRAEAADRRLVSWSEHDLNVVRTLSDKDAQLVKRFEARYCNARDFAEYWRNKLHGGDNPDPGALGAYLDLIDYDVPDEAGPGEVGETIRMLRPRLERGLVLTDLQQERWRRLLEHNRFDCAGMRRICIVATRELEAAANDNAALGSRLLG